VVLIPLALPAMFLDAADLLRYRVLLISASLAVAVLGVFIIRDAYRRWMAVEWG
jgi:hypothetical protein